MKTSVLVHPFLSMDSLSFILVDDHTPLVPPQPPEPPEPPNDPGEPDPGYPLWTCFIANPADRP